MNNGVTATTQSASDNSTKVATTAYTDTAISNLVASAPSTLDTLNELAAALGDDANFSTTVTNSIATKLPLAGGTLTGSVIIQNSSPSLTFSDTNNNPDYQIGNANGTLRFRDTTNASNRMTITSSAVDINVNLDANAGLDVTGNLTVSGTVDGRDVATDGTKLDGIESGATADQSASEILTLIKTVDGAGSGLNADLLDSLDSSSFLQTSSTTQQKNGALRIGGSSAGNGFGIAWSMNGTSAPASVGHNATHNEGFFWHTNSDYGIYRTAGNWSGNYQQLRLDWPTGIVLDGGSAFGLSGVRMDSHLLPNADNTYDIGASGNRFANGHFTNLVSNGGTFTADLTLDNNAFLKIGDGGGQERILIQKADNNISDHLIFYNNTTRVGEIGCEDNTWLRINQETAKNIYTPRYIRADGGFFVDSTAKGINGSGNFIGGTIAGASDYGTLLRSNADDSTTGRLGVGATASNANLVSYVSATGSIPSTALIQTNNSNHALGLWNGSNSASYCGLMLETRTSGASGWLIANEWQSTYHGDLVFRGRSGGTASTERLRIKSDSGRVEIKDGDLRLQNTVSGITNANSSSVLFRTFQTNGQVATTGGIHAQGQSAWGGDLVLSSKAANSTPNDSLTERVRITAEGSVKFIGNGTPGDNVGSNIIVGRNNTASEGGEIAMCRASDNSPYWKFDCFGSNAQPKLRMHRAGSSVFEFNNNGNFFRSGTTTSDRDLKENIQNLTGTSLDKVIQLTPKTFNFKESEGYVAVSKTGFIAQEVVSVIPSLVNGTDGNKDMGVDYDGVVAHLVNCVKELKELNDSLKARIEALEAS